MAVFVQKERENCCQQQRAAACCSKQQQVNNLIIRNISIFHQHSAAMYARYCDPIVSFELSEWQLVATAASAAAASKLLSTW